LGFLLFLKYIITLIIIYPYLQNKINY